MYIVAIAWIYVILMMSITEDSIVAGLVTFVFYGILPLTLILYIMGTPQRKRRRVASEAAARQARAGSAGPESSDAPDVPDVSNDARIAADPQALPAVVKLEDATGNGTERGHT